MSASRSDRTEKATPKRRREAREKGQIPRSKEVSWAITFILVVSGMVIGSSYFMSSTELFFQALWKTFGRGELGPARVQNLLIESAWAVIKLAGPLVALAAMASFASTFVQGGLVLSSEPMKFKADKINPAKNLQKVFSKQALVELVKSVSLVSIVVYLAYSVLQSSMDVFQMMVVMDVRQIVVESGRLLLKITLRVGLFLIVIAAIDYAFQRYRHEEELKMTKQQVKEDLKDTEGHPLVKGRIRRMQREMATKRMMAAVPQADVIITNPTHFAVALKYELEEMAAPQVVAKGQGFLALRIKKLAGEHDVPMVENVALAQTLYKTVEVGEEVPQELYHAVAKILAYVYRLKRERYS